MTRRLNADEVARMIALDANESSSSEDVDDSGEDSTDDDSEDDTNEESSGDNINENESDGAIYPSNQWGLYSRRSQHFPLIFW